MIRRAAAVRTRAGAFLPLVLGAAVVLASGVAGHAPGPGGGTTTDTATTTTSTSTTTTTLEPAAAQFATAPYATALATYLAGRPGAVTVAVRPAGQATPYVFTKLAATNVTASIVKVDIASTVLWQAQQAHRALTSWEQTELTAMIEQSDNTAATALWNHVGAGPAVAVFNRLVPMPSTTMGPGGYWGLTTTTAADQVALLDRLAGRNDLLSDASRTYLLTLMHRVVSWQAWGVSAGPPAGSVALKNGWLPRTDGWHVNSIGTVATAVAHYSIAVLTSSSTASEADEIATIQGVSTIVWRYQSGQVAPPPPPVLYVTHLLRAGSTDSAEVMVLQRRLTALGYDVHGVDGIFGPATTAGVHAFQLRHQLVANGVVGPVTGFALAIWR